MLKLRFYPHPICTSLSTLTTHHILSVQLNFAIEPSPIWLLVPWMHRVFNSLQVPFLMFHLRSAPSSTIINIAFTPCHAVPQMSHAFLLRFLRIILRSLWTSSYWATNLAMLSCTLELLQHHLNVFILQFLNRLAQLSSISIDLQSP